MFVGTCSDAGKSILNTAFCRIFKQDGYRPAPFKAQNMSLNSYSTPEGGEIGRAQAVQAEACGILPHTDMNPVLLKPSTDQTSQVILNGKAVGNMSAREYFRSGNKTQLFTEAVKAFHRLEENYNPIVLEGAGSISELNLRDRDITNMRMAKEVDAATYLVADIDRGGVFASVYGSVMLLPEEERCLIKGIIINKFRGDVSLFEEGRQIIRELTGVPVVGVIPYYKDIHIEEEDSVALEVKASAAVAGKINVAVIRLPRMSNFTDFNALERDGRFHLYYTDKAEEIGKADVIILPGTKRQATETQQKQLEDNGMAAFTSQSCTDAGVTVTAEQSITDNYNSHISFKVEGFQVEDGQQPDFGSISVLVDGKEDLNLDAGFYDGIIAGDDGMPVRASDGSSALDENGDMMYYYVQEDGSMEFDINMNNYSEKGFFIGKDIQVELKDLGTVDKAEFTKTLEGTWSFEWTLGGADTAKTYTLNQPLGDSGATIQTVEISPISVYAEYNFPLQKETITTENEDGTTSESTTFKEAPALMGIKLKDGTVIKNMYMGGGVIGYQNNSSDDYVYAYATDRIIDPDQIAYFLFLNDTPVGDQGLTEDNFYEVAVGENQQGDR